MPDQYSARERAAAEAMMAKWPLNGATRGDIMRLARVALRAADGVEEKDG